MTTPAVQSWILTADHAIATWLEDGMYHATCKCGFAVQSTNGGARNQSASAHADEVLGGRGPVPIDVTVEHLGDHSIVVAHTLEASRWLATHAGDRNRYLRNGAWMTWASFDLVSRLRDAGLVVFP